MKLHAIGFDGITECRAARDRPWHFCAADAPEFSIRFGSFSLPFGYTVRDPKPVAGVQLHFRVVVFFVALIAARICNPPELRTTLDRWRYTVDCPDRIGIDVTYYLV